MALQLTILVVDDEPQVLTATGYMLRDDVVCLARSGAEAIETCRSSAFDLILCDLMMPGMSGTAVYEALRELGTGAHQKVVFMTGWSSDAPELDGHRGPVLTKPLKLPELQQLLEQFRARKQRALDQTPPAFPRE